MHWFRNYISLPLILNSNRLYVGSVLSQLISSRLLDIIIILIITIIIIIIIIIKDNRKQIVEAAWKDKEMHGQFVRELQGVDWDKT